MTVERGTRLEFRANPADGRRFTSWEGNCAWSVDRDDRSMCRLEAKGNPCVGATFEP